MTSRKSDNQISMSVRRASIIMSISVVLASGMALPAKATAWTWSLNGDGVSASGTLTTTGTPNEQGFVQITDMTGSRNGIAVTGLQVAGTAVPGNPGYPVDNLLRAQGPQLTASGLGFALADGTYSNVFFADFQHPPAYYEFFSYPPFSASSHIEKSAAFLAVPVPEPATWSMLITGFGLVGAALRVRTAALAARCSRAKQRELRT